MDNIYKYREPTDEDLEYLARNMKHADRREVVGVDGGDILQSLHTCRDTSDYCSVCLANNVPMAIFGIKAGGLITTDGMIWLLSTPDIDRHKVYVAIRSRKIVRTALKVYTRLYNYVDVKNENSIKWLKWLGAEFARPEPYGVYGLPYRYFVIER